MHVLFSHHAKRTFLNWPVNSTAEAYTVSYGHCAGTEGNMSIVDRIEEGTPLLGRINYHPEKEYVL